MHDQSLGKPEVLEDAQETQCRVIDAGGARRTGLVDRPPSITVILDEILREILIEGYNYSVTPILVHGKEHEQDLQSIFWRFQKRATGFATFPSLALRCGWEYISSGLREGDSFGSSVHELENLKFICTHQRNP